MRIRLLLVMLLSACLGLGLAGTAQADSACGLVSVTPGQGPVGTPVNIYVEPIIMSGIEAQNSILTIPVSWDGTLVATLPEGPMGDFSGSFNVPSGSMTGGHTVTVTLPIGPETQEACSFPFTVTASVQQQAYTQSVTSMPSTGLLPLVPAVALLAAASGLLLARDRRR